MKQEQARRLARINISISKIAETLSKGLRAPQPMLDFLEREIIEVHKLSKEAELRALNDPEISREEMYEIGKIFGRMDSVHYIIMSGIKRVRR